MRNLAEAPIHITQNLNFDYTKTSPTAVVFISSPLVPEPPSSSTQTPFYTSPRRAISSRHRLRLTVSLTLPESEFNRKLGIFQVRVESLSANADVIAGSSYPMMLRFKSHAVRVIESSIKMLPLIAGMRSEVQNLRTVIEEFGEGKERIIGFKVSLEKRSSASQLEDGCGVPEIYDATLAIESKLPLLKRMVWNWRLTVFVWLCFASFVAEMMVVLLCCRPLLLPGRRINEKSE
ncbi:hypothetical protein C2S51_003747 [Perilla frutescens var. frutescens]|nr:hypothetical protein C2S51_003747 [Perilla frutescens var. frutescens]